MQQQKTPLELALGQVRRRLTAQRWVRYSLDALCAALALACVWLVLSRLFPALPDALLALPLLCGGALLGAALWALASRPTLLAAALAADARLGLKERLTSSLQLQGRAGPMVEAVHRDALHHLERINPRQDFPLPPSRTARYFIIPALLFGLGYLLLPELDLFGYQERALQAKAQARTLEAKARALRDAAQVLKPAETRPDAPLEGVSAELEGLAESLQRQEITEKQALARVTNLSQQLQQQREALQQQAKAPQLPGDAPKTGLAKDVAKNLQSGQLAQAAQKLREMQQKLRNNALTDPEKQQLAKDMQALQKMMQSDNSEASKAMADALADAAAGLEANNLEQVVQAMEEMNLSLEEVASALEQLAKLDSALGQLGEWKQAMLGPSEFCRSCGKKLGKCEKGEACEGACKSGSCAGVCGTCAGSGVGLGLGGAGRGTGNRLGELPEEEVALDPTVLPGGMNKGKLLARILQKAAPENAPAPEVEVVQGDFQAVRQEAEQALTHEEIPAGSKEFVRQYFGTLE